MAVSKSRQVNIQPPDVSAQASRPSFDVQHQALNASSNEIIKARRLTDLEFREQGGVIYAERKRHTTISFLGLGRLFSWITSFGKDANQLKQDLQALLKQQSSGLEAESSQFMASDSPTSEKVNQLVLHHQAFTACREAASKLLGAPSSDILTPASLQDRVTAIASDTLQSKRKISNWGITDDDEEAIKKFERLQAVVEAIEQSRFRSSFNDMITTFRENFELLHLQKTVLARSKVSLQGIERYQTNNPLLRLSRDAANPKMNREILMQALSEALRIQDLDKAFPDIHQELKDIQQQFTAHITCLPNEAIRKIAKLLPIHARAALAQASKRFALTAHTCEPITEVNASYLESYSCLPLDEQGAILDRMLKGTLTKFPQRLIDKFIDIYINACVRKGDGYVDRVVELLKTGKVTSLNIDLGIMHPTVFEKITNVPQIANLTKLTCNDNIGLGAIIKLLEKTPHLTTLELIGVNPQTNFNQSLPNLPNLRSFSIRNCHLSACVLENLPTTLETLSLKNVTIDSQACLNALEKIGKLDKLVLKVAFSGDDLELKLPPYLSTLTLSNISLQHNVNPFRYDVVPFRLNQFKILNEHFHLKHMIFEDFQKCSVSDLIPLLPPTVKTLTLRFTTENDQYFTQSLDDQLFTELAKRKTLESIEIDGSFPLISGVTIRDLPGTVKINLQSLLHLNDDGLKAYMMRHPSEFRCLDLSQLGDIDGSFLENAPNCIEEIAFQGALKISPKNFKHLVRQTNLKRVSISGVELTQDNFGQLPASVTTLDIDVPSIQPSILFSLSSLVNLQRLKIAAPFRDHFLDSLPRSLQHLTIIRRALYNIRREYNDTVYSGFLVSSRVELNGDRVIESLSDLFNLTELKIVDHSVTGKTLNKLPQLQKLTIVSDGIHPKYLVNLHSIPLRYLDIKSHLIDGSNFHYLPSSLEVLNISDCKFLSNNFINFGHLSHLHTLLYQPNNPNPLPIEHLAYLPRSIERLILSRPLNGSDMNVLQRFQNLRELCLKPCIVRNTVENWINLPGLPQSIQTLTLEFPALLSNLLPMLTHLHSLSLPNLRKLILIDPKNFGLHEFQKHRATIRNLFPSVVYSNVYQFQQ